jgi:hypothetical protein
MTREGPLDRERSLNRARSNVQNAANTLQGLGQDDLAELIADLRSIESRIAKRCKAASALGRS